MKGKANTKDLRQEKHGVFKNQQSQFGWRRVGKERGVKNEIGELGKNWMVSSQKEEEAAAKEKEGPTK